MTQAQNSHKSGKEAGRAIRSGRIGFWQKFRLLQRVVTNYAYDARRFRRHAYLYEARRREQLCARVLADAHFLEYGMALRNARPGFGVQRAVRLARDLCQLHDMDAQDGRGAEKSKSMMAIGRSVLSSYLEFNAQTQQGDLDEVRARAHLLQQHVTTENPAGTRTVTREAIQSASEIDFAGFAAARHSVRQFIPGAEPVEEIRRAVSIARTAPSSCNRQTCRVHAFTQPELMERVRKHQAGNRTFGHELSGLLVIASDLHNWETVGERYQPWIDGGLFAMTLLYGLHAQGLGTCMLNWSVEKTQDKLLRAELGLGDEHLVIAMIGIGWLPDRFSVCASHRLECDDILQLNQIDKSPPH
ncbi:nitroreductase family protein [Celeribacter neptunius]|nr:nitroreductase family protein [Celeribacter neptunius]